MKRRGFCARDRLSDDDAAAFIGKTSGARREDLLWALSDRPPRRVVSQLPVLRRLTLTPNDWSYTVAAIAQDPELWTQLGPAVLRDGPIQLWLQILRWGDTQAPLPATVLQGAAFRHPVQTIRLATTFAIVRRLQRGDALAVKEIILGMRCRPTTHWSFSAASYAAAS